MTQFSIKEGENSNFWHRLKLKFILIWRGRCEIRHYLNAWLLMYKDWTTSVLTAVILDLRGNLFLFVSVRIAIMQPAETRCDRGICWLMYGLYLPPVSHGISSPHGFPSPRIKYHMVKVPHLWDPPPPPHQKIEEICHRGGRFAIWYYSPLGSSAMGFFPGGGGGGGSSAIWFLPGGGGGRFATWYSFMGNVCHMA